MDLLAEDYVIRDADHLRDLIMYRIDAHQLYEPHSRIVFAEVRDLYEQADALLRDNGSNACKQRVRQLDPRACVNDLIARPLRVMDVPSALRPISVARTFKSWKPELVDRITASTTSTVLYVGEEEKVRLYGARLDATSRHEHEVYRTIYDLTGTHQTRIFDRISRSGPSIDISLRDGIWTNT